MPVALIFDQNPAIQALATHALKQVGFDSLARTGNLSGLLQEVSPDLLLCGVAHLKNLIPFLRTGKGRALLIGVQELSISNTRSIEKPFTSEQLLLKLKELLSLPIESSNADVQLSVTSPLLRDCLRLALEERGCIVAAVGQSALLHISEGKVAPGMLTLDELQRPLSRSLIEKLNELLPLHSLQEPSMPLSESERSALTTNLLRGIEHKLRNSAALRNRSLDALKEEISLVIEEVFQR